MAQFRVGCVPYVNARPLVAAFDQPNEFVEVLYDVPSKLPAMLESGQVDAILVSSIELLRRRDLIPVTDVGIMSCGPVMSVRMLAKVPLAEIKTLALDQSSMTSNILAQVILAEQGVFPQTSIAQPNAPDMLANHDACVIIGDRGFEADGTGLVDIDLGQAWTDMTGLPFVWALWLGKKDAAIDTTLLSHLLFSAYYSSGFSSLHAALLLGSLTGRDASEEPEYDEAFEPSEVARRKFVIESAMARSTWTFDETERYLTHGVRFEDPREIEALRLFAELVKKHGFADTELPLSIQPGQVLDLVAKLMPV